MSLFPERFNDSSRCSAQMRGDKLVSSLCNKSISSSVVIASTTERRNTIKAGIRKKKNVERKKESNHNIFRNDY